MKKYKAKSVTIEMPYPGAVISVNHYLGRSRYGTTYVKPEAKSWMDELGWRIKEYHIEDWKQPIKVSISGVFKDKRSTPDLSNLTKVCLDAIEETTGINDKYMQTATTDPLIGTEEPVIIITIQEVL